MDTYSILLFVHVWGAILWVGGAAMLNFLVHRAKGGDEHRLAT